MRRSTLIVLAAGAAAASTASGNLILLETISVPVNGSTVASTTVLQSGVEYVFEASGTFRIGGPGDGRGDAEYFNFANPPASLGDFSGNVDIGLSINGDDPDWGPYRPDHVYEQMFTGLGAAVTASYADTNYSDNSGDLTLRIFLVPAPAAPAAFAGLAFFAARRRR